MSPACRHAGDSQEQVNLGLVFLVLSDSIIIIGTLTSALLIKQTS